jgi:hypothetical protein
MDESERALSDAAQDCSTRAGRIASQTLGDSRNLSLWESRHAEMLLPVAERSRRAPQIFALRDIEVRLVHRRALIQHIRKHSIVGKERDRLFAVFYGPMETTNAMLAEHRQYTLAVSSRVSTDHLIDVMSDPVSVQLLEEYESIYSRYFEIYCFVVAGDAGAMTEMAKMEMIALKRLAMRAIRRIHSEVPDTSPSNFDRQALLARSGRYPVLDYMVV